MRALAVFGLALLAGCTVGPNYHTPALPTPPAYGEAHPDVAGAVPARWWTGLGDPVLSGLIERGLAQNLDLAAAASRVRQARLSVRETRAGLFPTVDATGQAQRTRISRNGGFGALAGAFGGGAGGAPGGSGTGGTTPIGVPGTVFNTYSIGFDASWEIDLFGGVRRQLQGVRARVESAQWSRADTAVSIAAEIADNYYQLRVLQRRAAIARSELAREQQTLAIIRARGNAGLTANVDVTRQLVQIATAEASLGPIEADGRALVHSLGILIGGTPETLLQTFAINVGAGRASVPPQSVALPPVPVGLPSELLRRRPDIRRAERELAGATADIGVAVADLYPRFTITTPFQLLSTGVSDLFQGNSIQATVGGSVNFPLLDFGRRRAVIGQRRETREQAYITYQQAVLTGLRETEDALDRLRIERARRVVLARGASNAQSTIDAIAAQYKYGLTDLTTVLDAQQALLQAQDNLAQSEGTISRQTIALYKALGGGWQALPPIGPRPERTGTTSADQPTKARSTR